MGPGGPCGNVVRKQTERDKELETETEMEMEGDTGHCESVTL